MTKMEWHKHICENIHLLYEKKNHDYGDSFGQTWKEEGFAMARIRLSDKLNRFKTLSKNGQAKVTDESIRDTLIDLANYAIMTVVEIDMETERRSNIAEMLAPTPYPLSKGDCGCNERPKV